MIPWLGKHAEFPAIEQALTEQDGAPGLLAAGGDLSPMRLLQAYRHGVFPWFSEGQPILWWSTDPRMVLFTDRFVASDSLKKTLRRVSRDSRWEVRFDSAFEQVMRACAAPRRDGAGTWISEDIVDGYCALHQLGYAHSSELWRDGELVGGAYGVSIGRMFYGESMFARVTDASKIALAHLVAFLKSQGVSMIDCQQQTAHLASLGAVPISRREFIEKLRVAIAEPQISSWSPIEGTMLLDVVGKKTL
jgi:leucyl/phenylalanyl-tRNA--protein transferase